MSKLTLGILIAAGVFLVMSGVIQVNVNSEKIPGAPKIGGGSAVEKVRSYAIRGKRIGQIFLVDNEKQRLNVSLDFVEADSTRLDELLEKTEDAATLVPQAELLLDSLDRAKELSRSVSPEVLAASKERSQQSFQHASVAINDLQTRQLDGDLDSPRLATVTASLATEVGGLTDLAPQVAGTSDEEEETGEEGADSSQQSSSQAESTPIPLQF